jgi:hypothetical protein
VPTHDIPEITMIRFLLLHRIEDTDRHGGKMLILAIVMMCVAMSILPSVPQ